MRRDDPGAIRPRRIVSDVLVVPACQFSDPVVLAVQMETDDGLLQDLRTSRLLFQRLIKIRHRLRRFGLPEPEQRLLLHGTRKIAAHHRNQRLVGRTDLYVEVNFREDRMWTLRMQ